MIRTYAVMMVEVLSCDLYAQFKSKLTVQWHRRSNDDVCTAGVVN